MYTFWFMSFISTSSFSNPRQGLSWYQSSISDPYVRLDITFPCFRYLDILRARSPSSIIARPHVKNIARPPTRDLQFAQTCCARPPGCETSCARPPVRANLLRKTSSSRKHPARDLSFAQTSCARPPAQEYSRDSLRETSKSRKPHARDACFLSRHREYRENITIEASPLSVSSPPPRRLLSARTRDLPSISLLHLLFTYQVSLCYIRCLLPCTQDRMVA